MSQVRILLVSVVLIGLGGHTYLLAWILVRFNLIDSVSVIGSMSLPLATLALALTGLGVIGFALATVFWLADATE